MKTKIKSLVGISHPEHLTRVFLFDNKEVDEFSLKPGDLPNLVELTIIRFHTSSQHCTQVIRHHGVRGL